MNIKPARSLSLMLLLCVAFSCKEKTYDCTMSHYYLHGCRISFEGYLPQEVDSIQWFSYKAGSNFAGTPVDSQWIYTDSFTLSNQEVYRRTDEDSVASFVALEAGLDYRIITPFKVHTVTDIETGPSETHFTSVSPCKGQASVGAFTSLVVDGALLRPAERWQFRYYTWLEKP